MRNTVILIGFVAVYLLVRVPYYGRVLTGEEGIFAYIFLNHPVGPNYGLFGRIAGRELVGPLEHPAFLYELISGLGSWVERFVNLHTLPENVRTFILRVSFSLFQLTALVLLLWLILFKRNATKNVEEFELRGGKFSDNDKQQTKPIIERAAIPQSRTIFYPVVLIFLISISPIALTTSTQLQVDGSVGVLLGCILPLGIYAAFVFHRFRFWRYYGLLTIVSFAAGLGKNEWSLALLLAQGLFVACLILFQRRYSLPQHLRSVYLIALFSLLGLVLGNTTSYIFDPLNYRGGLDVMFRISQSNISQSHIFIRWIKLSILRLPYIFTIAILLFGSTLVIATRLKKILSQAPDLLLIFFYSTALFFGFLFSTWDADPRYFAPAFIAFSITAVALFELIPQRYMRTGFLVVSAILCIHTLTFFSIQFLSPAKNYLSNSKMKIAPQACIPLLDTAAGYFNKQIDFIGSSLSKGDAEVIAGRFGKRPCL